MYSFSSSIRNLSEYNQMVYFNKNLVIETYIIGYKNEGESILFFIRVDGGISFSGLVDCFQVDGVNKVKDILAENSICKLDFICWTHPDLDHSKGMKEILNEYVSAKTQIWIPEGVDVRDIKCSKEVKDLFSYLKECVVKEDAEFNVYSASDQKDLLYYNSICFQRGMDRYPLKLFSYTPNSKIIRKQTYMDKFKKNDRSIFFVLGLGDVRIFLTGDIEDDTIERIPRGIFGEHIHIMKIPHHGSDSSVKMLELGWNECDIACSTVYRKGTNLPVESIMKQYSENAKHLLCTGKVDREKEKEQYGMVKIMTDVIKNEYSINIEGNADIWSA